MRDSSSWFSPNRQIHAPSCPEARARARAGDFCAVRVVGGTLGARAPTRARGARATHARERGECRSSRTWRISSTRESTRVSSECGVSAASAAVPSTMHVSKWRSATRSSGRRAPHASAMRCVIQTRRTASGIVHPVSAARGAAVLRRGPNDALLHDGRECPSSSPRSPCSQRSRVALVEEEERRTDSPFARLVLRSGTRCARTAAQGAAGDADSASRDGAVKSDVAHAASGCAGAAHTHRL